LWAEGLRAKDIHNKMFPVYGGKCLSHKAIHKLVMKRGKHFAGDKEVETEVRNWLSFDTPVKGWDKYINVAGGYVALTHQ
jgi:hypothetical protein